jgi:hypothetical protein
MLTWGDDYPIHQTPDPVAFAGSDRNFYDRYFFNGYTADGGMFFAAALGVYPHLDIMDASFSLLVGGRQHNIRASKHLKSERMNLQVGPIEVSVLEPLRTLRVRVSDNDSGISADLTFAGRHAPIEEPRFTRRQGPRMFMDYTRMTQNGSWSGAITIEGQTITMEPGAVQGTRDRSWGVRPVGAPDSQPPAVSMPQFFWLWAPFNFADRSSFFHTNDDAAGKPWNRRAVIAPKDGAAAEYERPALQLTFRSGTRRVRSADIRLGDESKASLHIEPTGAAFYMSGLGYTHRTWGHGSDHGALATAYDTLDPSSIDDSAPEHMHIQALARAVLSQDGREVEGFGVLEQLLLGPHGPSGLTGLLDPAR